MPHDPRTYNQSGCLFVYSTSKAYKALPSHFKTKTSWINYYQKCVVYLDFYWVQNSGSQPFWPMDNLLEKISDEQFC